MNPLLSELLCVVGLFLLCTFLVIGVKTVYYSIKQLFKKPEVQIPIENKERVKRQESKRPKSIEIDTDSVDKIFFRKSS